MGKTQENPQNICTSAMRVVSGRYVCARTLAEPMCKLTVIGPVCPCPDQNELRKCAKLNGKDGAGTEKKTCRATAEKPVATFLETHILEDALRSKPLRGSRSKSGIRNSGMRMDLDGQCRIVMVEKSVNRIFKMVDPKGKII